MVHPLGGAVIDVGLFKTVSDHFRPRSAGFANLQRRQPVDHT